MIGRLRPALPLLLVLLFAMLAPLTAVAAGPCCPTHAACALMAQPAPKHSAGDRQEIRPDGQDNRHHHAVCPAGCPMAGCASAQLLRPNSGMTSSRPGLRIVAAYPLPAPSGSPGQTGRPALPPPRALG